MEVARLGEPVKALPLTLPAPAKLVYHASDIPPRDLPADATPDQVREHARREAERQAVKTLAFDPMVDDARYISPVPEPRK